MGLSQAPSPERQYDLSNHVFQVCCHFGSWNVKTHDTGLFTATSGRGGGLEFTSEQGLCQGCVRLPHQAAES